MLTFTDLNRMAVARVEDAKILFAAGRYDGAAYVVGYAVEYKLKARIATGVLARGTFPESKSEFNDLAQLKNHNLEQLLALSGRGGRVGHTKYKSDWSYLLTNWNPDKRYAKIGTATRQSAADIINAVENLLKAL